MADYTPTAAVSKVDDAQYEAKISLDAEPKEFIAIVSNTVPEGTTQREIVVEVMEVEVETPADVSTEDLYVKAEGETSVKVTVNKGGQEVGSTVTDY